ncbi:MAG: Asp-tRNA(Asn)/Glu-tRNA(Gln) amidotransferase subunit GatA [Candidatus Koribacter versatilis]|uniref:Glutamyl-tRNA(Gln) amidotransferase subunit A n=1 Tax=Candidatus Korobacter versatilis TaxID=658062 RepID=A0A932ERI3_9BACT|nr:Asp-tRNA(Asn)/Glu-tRNA(Gln) amidotransferase subunit GatA [Candidatus Koribacter versatilis]
MDPTVLTVESTRVAIQEKQFSATALVEALHARIERDDTHAWLTHPPERALAQAAAIDKLADKGGPLPPLAGVPIGIKDVILTRGLRTTAGSKVLQHFFPPYDATAVARLEAAGAIVMGKTNCDEFAMGSSNENSAYGVVKNPHDKARVPGGSSGGSAAAVANGTAVAALGSDTGGSIRQPAAFCGIVGLMPSYGRVSRYGLIAFASSLDRIGPMTRSVKDAALILQHIAGHDPLDSTCANVPVPDYAAEIGKPVKGLKVGVPKEYFAEGLDDDVRASVEAATEKIHQLGCEVVPISLPHTKYAIPTYYVLATAEASSNLARYDGVRYGFRIKDAKTLTEMYRRTRDEGFGYEVKRRIMLGTYVLSAGYYDAYYLKAQRVRTLLSRDFDAAFAKVDAIVTPTTPTAAFKLGEKAENPLAMYLADIYTVTGNLAGVPAIAVPCGKTKTGLPIGLQIFARRFDEPTLLRLGHAYEHARGAF